jgi:hypothetical protein
MKPQLKDRNRDNYMRCRYCFQLFHHSECTLDEDGYHCPNLCVKPFIQDDYATPTQE